ncbi:MAG TPA: MFS transporter [Dongiaceae bacterium]|nr:MFS transporter [Dongiaceae bacterium]
MAAGMTGATTPTTALSSRPVPYWRLSSFYFFYFTVVGAQVPFWTLYLHHMGFSLVEIGTLTAIQLSTRLFAPNLWGWIGDRTNKRIFIIRVGALLTALAYAGVFLHPGFWGIALVMAGFNFFWNAILPQFEVITLQHLKHDAQRYSLIRLWGSIGFIASVVGLGWYFEHHPLEQLPIWVTGFMVMIMVATVLVTQPEGERTGGGGFAPFLQQMRNGTVLMFFLLCFLMQVSHGPYYAFFSIFLQDEGYSRTLIGGFWAIGVLAEIGVFLLMHRIIGNFNARTLAIGCLLAGALRWWLTGYFPNHTGILVLAQLGHAATFGVFHALAIHLIHRFFTQQASGQGQAVYSAFCYGAGNAAGAYLAGLIVQAYGGAVAYYAASVLLLLSAVLAYFLFSRVDQTQR